MRSYVAAAAIAAVLSYSAASFGQQAPANGQQAPAGGQTPAASQPFEAGQPLGIVSGGKLTPTSNNVKVYGGVVNAESCSYDESRDLIVSVNRGVNQNQVPNDAFVSLINHDGSVQTAKWIGVNRNGLVLNQPFGSDIAGGKLYVADSDGDTSASDPRVAVVRMFDMNTGAPAGEIKVPESPWFNDIEVDDDGTVYASQTGSNNPPDPTTFKIFKITPDGKSTVLIQGAPLNRPNGVAFDTEGNLVVVNIVDDAVLTFSKTDGKLLNTEHAAQDGSDGLVIMPDGTKYVSSVIKGGVSKIPAGGGKAGLIATAIPMGASMCYDAGGKQLVVPMNTNNGLAFIKLD